MDNVSRGALDERSRWRAFIGLCFGSLMTVMDGSIVNVALPTIGADLGFSRIALVWVVNAYLLTFGGFLLLGGRLGDLFGQRRLFLCGIALFTVASAGCGLAHSPAVLIGARAVQGLGGALVTPTAYSLTANLFEEGPARAKALGVFGFAAYCGGMVGLLLGGALTSAFGWHWIFLINLPLGVAVYGASFASLPHAPTLLGTARLDIAGAATVTVSVTLAVYAILSADSTGWQSARTAVLLTSALALLILFLRLEARIPHPLVPLSLFRRRDLMVTYLIFALWTFTTTAWALLLALYLQIILGYRPNEVGLSLLPASLVAATLSLGLSAKLVLRWGIKTTITIGLLCASAGFAFLARARLDGTMTIDVLPAMLCMGVGYGIAPNALWLAAVRGTTPSESGLVSGTLCTVQTMSGALGLAILAGAAAAHTSALVTGGASTLDALNRGYHIAFSIAAGLLAVASLLNAVFLRVQGQDKSTVVASALSARQSSSIH